MPDEKPDNQKEERDSSIIKRTVYTESIQEPLYTLAQSEIEWSEETVTGEDAVRFYEMLTNPPDDSEREEFIKEALQKFPEPDILPRLKSWAF
ncbi:MAG: hypothetical protein P1Q69_09875 [Candidatus Thorarchaeota archaeon]|nr:hypothetical protein [Candidatus Thorarchaeota archaeon]